MRIGEHPNAPAFRNNGLVDAIAEHCRTVLVAAAAAARPSRPGFTLKQLAGGEASLSEFRGRTVLVNFWGYVVYALSHGHAGDHLRLPGASRRPRASDGPDLSLYRQCPYSPNEQPRARTTESPPEALAKRLWTTEGVVFRRRRSRKKGSACRGGAGPAPRERTRGQPGHVGKPTRRISAA